VEPSIPESHVPTIVDPAGSDPFRRAVAALTEAQRLAVDSPSIALCVVAGAGSGKTRVLTLRVGRRVRDGSAEADHTLVCTFTRKAAGELRDRLATFGVPVAVSSSSGGPPGPGVRAGTLHQLALHLLRRHALDAGRSMPAVLRARDQLIAGFVHDAATASIVDTEIGWAKARCLTPDSYVSGAAEAERAPMVPLDTIAAHFMAYEDALARRHALDLDDLLIRSADLILTDEVFAEAVHWRYRHLSVDEFQDVNPAQFRLIDALMGDRHDLFAVGDPNQSIYQWNGADPELMIRLPTLVPQMSVVHLDQNHRSTPQVVAAAAAALGASAKGVPRAAGSPGPMPTVTAYEDETEEAEGIAAALSRADPGGRSWSQHAVLARTNDQLNVVGRALRRAGIPFRVAPGPETSPADAQTPVRRRPDTSGNSDRDHAVELATFHRAKGLEWQTVFIIGIEDGYVPIVHAESAAARDEERRLLYVALTRASQEVHCSWARSRRTASGRRVDREPSPWLAAVARVSRIGRARNGPPDTGKRIAEIRAGLRR
jgi:DNA helicase II / ATP-dependent DNA helicase PcrA